MTTTDDDHHDDSDKDDTNYEAVGWLCCVVYPIFKLDPFPDTLVCPHARSCQLKGGLDKHRYQRLQAQFKSGVDEHRYISYQKHNSQTQGLLKGSLSTARDVKCE